MKKPYASSIIALLAILVLAALACNLPTGQQATPTSQSLPATPLPTGILAPTEIVAPTDVTPVETPTTPPVIPTPPPNVYTKPFAEYPSLNVRYPSVYSGGYSLPVDLGSVQGMDIVTLSDAQRALLSQNGFVVSAPVPGEYDEFYQVYEHQRYYEQPIFATTDAVFHVYHLIFDKMLRDLEHDSFIPDLQVLTHTLLDASIVQYQAVRSTALEEPARRNVAYFAVAAQLLGLPDPVPPEAADLVNAELALIQAHAGFNKSPIWDRTDLPEDKKLIEDYGQYVPRGHYTRSEELKKYFTAMMWYGRLTFRLRDGFETKRALLLTQALQTAIAPDGRTAIQLWANIYEPTAFIVGKADDLSFQEYGVISSAVYGANPNLFDFADEGKLAQFTEAARTLPPPQVNSMWVWIWEDKAEATQGFRVMGQRFTLDSYVFGQVIWRNVGTQEQPRELPKGMDFFAALGSAEALNILAEMGENQYANFDTQMAKVRTEIAALGQDSWTQNLYWSWLYAFQPFVQPKDNRYPAFMQTQAWTRKDLHTALGSWTELKHDTILYAKQVMAEMGGGGAEHPPHGWVEPNPEAYARLWALAQMTYDGLEQRGLLSERTRGSLENLTNLLRFMQDISERELAGEALTDEEYWRIQYFGGELESLTIAASDCDGEPWECRDLSDQKAALVADVATGMTGILEEGVGQPTRIYVVLPDQPWRIGVGAVFTYYEFKVGFDQRMTDETWQALVASPDVPPQPDWTSLFIAP